MKQKENIFEELGRMRSLIHAKPGVVISEQAANPATDIATIKAEMGRGIANSDEQKVVDVLKKYTTDKATFQNFLNQYKTVTGTALTDELPKQFQPDRDQGEIRDLNASLNKLGITFQVKLSDDRRRFVATFLGLDTPAAPAAVSPEELAKLDALWQTTYSCVTTQPGVKQSKMKNGSTVYILGQVVYYSNGRKKLADGTMTNYSCATEFKSKSGGEANSKLGGDVNTRFSKSAESLGIQGGKMDLQTLQSILKTLEGGQSTAAATGTPAAATGTPDLAQLTAALNQLNQ